MQSDSSSLETLKESLLSAVDTNYNVTQPETVLKIISQLETIEITRDQLHSTRLGREINNIRQKIDARKKSVQQQGVYPDSIIEIAHRAKKLLKSWQGLLNTSQNEASTTTIPTVPIPQSTPTSPPPPIPATPPVVNPPIVVNGDSHESTSPNSDGNKPRIILKVKINPKIGPPTTPTTPIDNDPSKSKRKHDSDANGHQTKRRKNHLEIPKAISSPHSPSPALIETTTSLPRIKTTQQLLMEMQLNQPDVLSTQNPTVNAILQNKIIDESLHEPSKVDYNALHHGRESLTNSIISPANPSTKRSSSAAALATAPSSTSTTTSTTGLWENGTSAGGSPISPSSSSSSSSSSLPLPTNIPEPPQSVPLIPKKKRRRKSPSKDNELEQITTHSPAATATTPPPSATFTLEQSTTSTSDLSRLCSAYKTVAELTEAHCRRVRAEHDARELEARPELLLVPLDQLAFVYERERTQKSSSTSSPPPPSFSSSSSLSSSLPQSTSNSTTSKATSLTSIHLFQDDPNRVALPFIDCPLEFDLALDDLVIQDFRQ